jgi:hypothetical protein
MVENTSKSIIPMTSHKIRGTTSATGWRATNMVLQLPTGESGVVVLESDSKSELEDEMDRAENMGAIIAREVQYYPVEHVWAVTIRLDNPRRV